MLFISHDQEDQAPLSQLRLIAKLAGVECWSPAQMKAGILLREQLRTAIRECDVCLFLATRRSIGSSWCRAELGAFWGAGKRVVSLVQDPELTDLDLPPQLQGDLWTRNAEAALDAVREEVANARRRDPMRHSEAKRAVCLVTGRDSDRFQGTGYLVASDLVVCPDYLTKESDLAFRLHFFGGEEVDGQAIPVDNSARVALIRLSATIEGLIPVRFADRTQPGSICRGLGFPGAASGSAVPFHCEVVDADHSDRGERWVVVQSPLFATAPLHGLGGSPIWDDAGVIGHAYRLVQDFGIVFLTPASTVFNELDRVVGLGRQTRR